MKSAIARVWGPVSLVLTVIMVSCGPADCVSGVLCDDGTQTPTSLSLSLTTVDFASFGATQQLVASVTDQNGQAISGASVTWLSSNPGAATVSGGLVTSVGNGTATITAAAGAATGTATVTVTQVATSVTATPADVLIEAISGTQALSATAVDAEGSAVAGFTYAWSSDTESVATVDADGVVTAITEGTAEITVEATSGSSTFSATVAVTVDVPLTITTDMLPAGVVSVLYADTQLMATGGATYVWELAQGSLPTGLTLSSAGVISGTPTAPGTFDFTVSVGSEGSTAEAAMSITISDVPELALSTSEMRFVAATGSTSSTDQALTVMNDGESVLQWGVSSDEAWLTLSPASGATADVAQVTVTADPTGLTSGDYVATITATAASPATGSPQTVEVTLTVAPLLGNSVAFAGTSSISPGYLLGSPLIVTTSTTLTHLSAIGREVGANFKLALYADVDGSPGSLVASTASTAAAVGVQNLPVTPVALPAGIYWIMGIYDATGRVGFSNTGEPVVKYIAMPFGDPIPATFGAHSTYSGQEFNYSILVTDAQASTGPVGGPVRIAPATVTSTGSRTSPPGS